VGFVLFTDDVHAKFNAFITDEHGRPGNQFPNFVLTFPTERTVECVLGIAAARFVHWPSRLNIGQLRSILVTDGARAQSNIWALFDPARYVPRLLFPISLAAAIAIIAVSALIAVIIFYRTLRYHFVNKPEFHGFRG
jgi:hypothetical protein